jgi:ubiquitin-protein ligase E3 C
LGSRLVYHGVYDRLQQNIFGWAVQPDTSRDQIPWHGLLLYCDLDTRVLATTSHEEFQLRRLNDLKLLSGIVKAIVKDMMWDSAVNTPFLSGSFPTETIYDTTYKITTLTKWMSFIFMRDSISPFCGAGHWLFHIPDLRTLLDAIPTFELQETDVSTLNGMKIVKLKQILETIPFVIPFEERVYLFRKHVQLDRQELGNSFMTSSFRARIRRAFVFEDGFAQLNSLSRQLRDRVAIEFIDEHGIQEAGIDGGGLFKEFLVALLKKAFDTRLGLFQTTREGKMYPATTSYACQPEQLELFAFLGRMVGKALYEGVLVERMFARFFLSKWIGKRSYFHDLPELDTELYNGLVFLKNYDGNVEDLSLTMSLTQDQFGTKEVVDLRPKGSQIVVTNQNKVEYIFLTANYRLNTQISKQANAFFTGLLDLVQPSWLKMFNEEELQVLIGGVEIEIDTQDLQQHTTYGGIYDPEHPTIKLFWKVVQEMSQEELKLLVKFVTSVPRPPLLGFGELHPPFCIHVGGQEQDRLPSSSTCLNLLKLPEYSSELLLKE